LADLPFGVALFQDIQGGFRPLARLPGPFGAAAPEDEVKAQADDDEPKDGHEQGEDPKVPLPVMFGIHGSLLCRRAISGGDPAGRPYLRDWGGGVGEG